MKTLIKILPIFFILTSCDFSFIWNPPDNPNNKTNPTYRHPTGTNSNGNKNEDNTNNNNGSDDVMFRDTIVYTTDTIDTVIVVSEDEIPEYKWDSCTINGILTFNIYLGWNIGQMETSVKVTLDNTYHEIDFNIYTNEKSMSMYGFEKYATNFYTFSDVYPYCGFYSFSENTPSLCKYKIKIKENHTNTTRKCLGYWAANEYPSFYSSFRLLLTQTF